MTIPPTTAEMELTITKTAKNLVTDYIKRQAKGEPAPPDNEAGQVIALPERRADRPNPDFLQWHLDTVFKAA